MTIEAVGHTLARDEDTASYLASGASADGAESTDGPIENASSTSNPIESGSRPLDSSDTPLAQPTFTHWPLPVGRVEVRDGLTYVHSARASGFSAADYRKIPDKRRIELLDGVVVVHPEPCEGQRRLVRHFYDLLEDSCPDRFHPYLGPLDVPIGRATVFAPDLLVLSSPKGYPPALVVEVRENRGAHYRSEERRVKFRGYSQVGVGAYWELDPTSPTVTVYELGYLEWGSYPADEVRAKAQANGWGLWSNAG